MKVVKKSLTVKTEVMPSKSNSGHQIKQLESLLKTRTKVSRPKLRLVAIA